MSNAYHSCKQYTLMMYMEDANKGWSIKTNTKIDNNVTLSG